MRYQVRQGDREILVEIDGVEDGPRRARVDGVELDVEIRSVEGAILLVSAGRTLEIIAAKDKNGERALWTSGGELHLEVLDERQALARAARGGAAGREERRVLSPMPGRVVKVLVGVGDAVKKGQGAVIVEAMKMENELVAPREGTVRTVLVEPGKAVESGQVLVELE